MGRKKLSKKIIKDVFELLPKFSNDEKDSQKRKDYKGRIIAFHSYGKRDHKYGWNIDHINRNTENNSLENLRAVHYETHEELNIKYNKKHFK